MPATELHVITMETSHFNFQAVGATREEAVKALELGWAKHREQAGQDRVAGMPEANFYALESEFGTNYMVLSAGQCYRDYSAIL